MLPRGTSRVKVFALARIVKQKTFVILVRKRRLNCGSWLQMSPNGGREGEDAAPARSSTMTNAQALEAASAAARPGTAGAGSYSDKNAAFSDYKKRIVEGRQLSEVGAIWQLSDLGCCGLKGFWDLGMTRALCVAADATSEHGLET